MGNKLGKRRPLVDERYTKPQGLYQHKDVDQRRLRKLILDGKLAPCYIGVEEAAFDLDECPICFLHYPSLNRSKCCTKGICTECFLQVKPPHSSSRPTQCPFCKTQQYAVEYRGFRTQEEKGVEQAEEQKVIEAKIRIRQQELLDEEERQIQRLGSPNDVVEDIQPPVSSGDDGGILVERDVGWGVQGGTPAFERVRQRDDRVDTNRHQEQSLFLSSSDLSQREGGLAPQLSSRIATANDMVTQAGQGGTHPYMRHNRDEEFMDLEEFMVMKAIFLSLQEQGMQQPAPIDSMVLVNTNAPVQYMHANGLRHRVGTGEPYMDDQTPGNSVAGDRNSYANQALHFQGVDISGNQHGGLQNVQRYRNEDYVPHGSPWPGARESTTAGQCPSFWTHEDGTGSSQAVDQRSEVVEGGTSFCNNIPSGSDLPWEGEAPEIASNAEGTVEPMGTVAVPDSFEDQIILAIALSLAEAQGKSNIRANGRKD